MTDSNVKRKARKLIDENPVVVFSRSNCPYCEAAKALLRGAGATFLVYELDKDDDGDAVQAVLKEFNNHETVPNIYIKRSHIGGYTELVELGSLMMPLLIHAGAAPRV
ncbi:hypothetical protein K3495_g9074 [Podosphaera aphanis]|nr:hypothetical protein K3495_g9074 [Podosphaera aphanis]